MTRAERAEWESLKSDDGMRRFIDAFRASHTPDFVAEVQRRAEIVDERMAQGDAKASLTTRGKIVILLGAPAEVKVRSFPWPGPGNVGHPLETRKGGAADQARLRPTMSTGAWIEYTLRFAPNPAMGIGPEGWSVVLEADSVSGKDHLKYPRRHAKQLEAILDAAARTALRSVR